MKYRHNLIIVILTLLIFSRFWSCTLIPSQVSKLFEIILIIFYTLHFLHKETLRRLKVIPYGRLVFCLIMIPFFSIIPCFLVHGQNPAFTLYMLRFELTLLFYFYLHNINIKECDLCRILLSFSIIWAALQVIQQFTYPTYFFAQRGDDYFSGINIEIRNGIYRFLTAGFSFALIPLFYSYCALYDSRKKLINLFALVLLLVGFYLLMTRQLLVAIVIGVFVVTIFKKSVVGKLLVIPAIFVALFFTIKNSNAIFGDLVELTQQQLEYNVRYEAYSFFIFEYWDHAICFLFGNGIEHASSSYGQEIFALTNFRGISRADIGIFGALSYFGILYVLLYVKLFISIIGKLPSSPLYLAGVFFVILTTTVMINHLRGGVMSVAFCIFLYLLTINDRRRVS